MLASSKHFKSLLLMIETLVQHDEHILCCSMLSRMAQPMQLLQLACCAVSLTHLSSHRAVCAEKLLMLVKTLRLMPSGYTWSFCVFAPELLMLSCPCSMDSKNSSLGAQAIDPDESMWSMDDDVSQHGDDMKVLLVHLMRPPLTESEMTYKRGAAGVHGQ